MRTGAGGACSASRRAARASMLRTTAGCSARTGSRYSRPRTLCTAVTVLSVTVRSPTSSEARKFRWPASVPSSSSCSVRATVSKLLRSPRSMPISPTSTLRSPSSALTQGGAPRNVAAAQSAGSRVTPAGSGTCQASSKSVRGNAALASSAAAGTGTPAGLGAKPARRSRTHGDHRAGRATAPVTASSALSSRPSITASCSQRTATGQLRIIAPRNRPARTCRSTHRSAPSGSTENSWYPASPASGGNVHRTRRPGSYAVTR